MTPSNAPASVVQPSAVAWDRWAVVWALAGLIALIPAYFVPAMLVANAVDGPRWYSVWSGIRDFYGTGNHFLALLIFTFSMVFPLVKLLLCLLCAAGQHWLPRGLRHGIIQVTSWSAKYSMLDVLVIAMAIMLVKVGDYVRIMPSMGIYLFSFAILCSAVSGWLLQRALANEARGLWPAAPRWGVALLLLVPGLPLAVMGLQEVLRERGGRVESVRLTRLTQRGELKRSVEKTLALKELIKEDHKLFSKDTLRRMLEFSQAVSTDAGWQEADVYVAVDRKSGGSLESGRIRGLDFEAREVNVDFTLPSAVPWEDVAAVRLVSTVKYAGLVNAPIEEENVRAEGDPFREWTRQWHGRVFSFDLRGPRGAQFVRACVMAGAGVLLSLWALSGLLCGGRRRRPGMSEQSAALEVEKVDAL
ncbi:MAG: hypothetical protein RLZZ179_423 [Verrucomicrobiota bacterium]|jgi:paraquat-inducible protein A